jgi:hypothetical protein
VTWTPAHPRQTPSHRDDREARLLVTGLGQEGREDDADDTD